MEVAALKYSGSSVLAGRSPLLRLQSDERLIALTRRGNVAAFETLVARYEVRLLAFCRHMLSSREDAEDILQEVMAAAYGAITADARPINARPWLYRIARNRCLNHLRRAQPIGVDSMDIHFGDSGRSTADKVDEREAFRLLVDDIQELPESQKTALVLRELEALSYEQIAEAMETTIPSVKSLLVRARASLAEASEARLLSCDEVRIELAEVAEGLRPRPSPPVRRHVKQCEHCATYATEVRRTGRALAVLLPIGPLAFARKALFGKAALGAWGHGSGVTGGVGATSASATGSIAATSASATGPIVATSASATGSIVATSASATGSIVAAGAGAAGSGSLLTAGVTAIATKAVAGIAAAALVTAGAVEAGSSHRHHQLAAAPSALAASTTGGSSVAMAHTRAVTTPRTTTAPAKKVTAPHQTLTATKPLAATTTVTTTVQQTATTAAVTTTTQTLPTSTVPNPAVSTIPTPASSTTSTTSTSGGTGLGTTPPSTGTNANITDTTVSSASTSTSSATTSTTQTP